MVASNLTLASNCGLTVLPSLGMQVRRVSNASIDKLAAQAKKAPLKAIKKGATKAKSVRFSDKTKVIARKARANANEEELPTWYQPKDYAIIKYEILTSIHAISKVFKQENTTPLDLEKHCLRGIETGISSDLNERRKLRIRTTLQSVLEQQRLQRMVGVSDPLALRAISLQCSKDAQDSAVSVGKLDSQL